MTSQEYKAHFDPQMQEFCEKNGIHFYPWIGSDYYSSQHKMLLLGESYYLDTWNPEGRFDWDITKDASPLAIRKYLGEEQNHRVETKEFITHDKATRVILGITGRRVSTELLRPGPGGRPPGSGVRGLKKPPRGGWGLKKPPEEKGRVLIKWKRPFPTPSGRRC